MAYQYQPATTPKKMNFSQELQTPKFQNLINRSLTDKNDVKRFVAEIMTCVSQNPALQQCDNLSIVSAGLLAQTMNLSLSPSLGCTYLVPYKDKKTGTTKATFQIGYKGLIQLALRSGYYERMGVRPVHEGEYIGQDEFGEDEFKFSRDNLSKPVIGYCAYFVLTTGFKKKLYMTKEECEEHGRKFSKNYSGSLWGSQFDVMAQKTVLKLLISRYGLKSVELSKAIQSDQAVVNADNTVTYVDTETQATVPLAETGEIATPEPSQDSVDPNPIDEEKELF